MPAPAHLAWPFFDAEHRDVAIRAREWAEQHVDDGEPADVDAACRDLVARLGAAGWLKHAVPARFGGARTELDARTICILRETFAERSALADFAFAMQGLGSGAITLYGSDALRAAYLPRIAAGEAIAAFALSEPEAGSDVAAVQTTARKATEGYVLDGRKTWISNGGIADFYVVVARSESVPGKEGLSAFVVDAGAAGLDVEAKIEVIAPHPLATLKLREVFVPASHLLGRAGDGFAIAMRTLDVFRASVAAAAVGLARRALREAVAHARQRRMFGQTLADFQLTQAAVGDMAAAIDASALLTYRAAWMRDRGEPVTKEAAMAKMTATEMAQAVVDRAVQLFGGLGVTKGTAVERLYREVRALRIYEGATEVQRLIVGRKVIAEAGAVP